MTELVQKSGSNFFTETFHIRFRNVPKVFQKQNNLRRHRHVVFFNKFRAREQTKRIQLNSICLQFRIWLPFKYHRQLFRTHPQWFRQ